MKEMIKIILKEMVLSKRKNPSAFTNGEYNNDNQSYEEEQDDNEVEILSSGEDMDLCTDQEIIPKRSNLKAQKKIRLEKGKKLQLAEARELNE